MIPYFFICNRKNYSRYAPLYFLQMNNDLTPEVQSELSKHFSIKFTSRAFRGLWSDMGVEMSVIKDNKSEGGIIGFTRRADAVIRWSLSRNIVGNYARSIKERCNQTNSDDELNFVHESEQPSQLQQDERDILKILNHINNYMTDPFNLIEFNDKLINIGNGIEADPEVQKSLLNAVQTGHSMLKDFVYNRLDSQCNSHRSFYDVIKKSNLKTFTGMQKKVTIKRSDGSVSKEHVSPELVYQRALVLSKE